MFRRNSSKSKRGLNRSKSATSIHRSAKTYECLDPVAAERDAHIAAAVSYARASERSSGDMSGAGKDQASALSRGNSNASRAGNELRRQQSVRFVGPASGPKPSAPTWNRDDSSAALTVLTRTENRPSTRTSSGDKTTVRSLTGRYLSALEAAEEYYTPEDDIASAPSSYRRLRKSKSMHVSSVQTTPAYFFSSGSPGRRGLQNIPPRFSSLSNKENAPPSPATLRNLRGPKSMTFLRGRREQGVTRASSREENDLAVQVARDKFREQVQQQKSLKSQPSLFFRSRTKRTGSALSFRKSLRNISSGSNSSPVSLSPDTIRVPKEGLRKKARKVSRNLKNRIKSLFSLSKSDTTDSDSPLSAIEPKKESILVDGIEGDPDSFMNLTITHQPDGCSVSQVPSHITSIHDVPSAQQLHSRQGSMESLQSEKIISDERSRVTSWTSSAVDKAASQCNWGEWERQRLSVIKENGTHVSTSSFKRPALGCPVPYALSCSSPGSTEEQLPLGPAVDSQRIYSALIKRMDETRRREHDMEKLRQRSIEDFRRTSVVPPRTSSADRGVPDIGASGSCTIRCVGSEDDVFLDTPVKTKFGRVGDGDSVDDGGSSSGSIIRGRQRSSSAATAGSYGAYPGPVAGDGKGLSPKPARSGLLGDASATTKTLSTRNSAFFGSPSYHLFRTASPYRKALQDNIEKASNRAAIMSPESNPFLNLSVPSLPSRRPSTGGSFGDARLAYSESVYSVATVDGDSLSSRDVSSMAAKFPQPPTGPGDTTVSVDPPMHRSTMPMPTDRVVSTASSVEWKTWLSSNVSKLESPPSHKMGKISLKAPYAVPTMPKSFGHVREGTEIGDEVDGQVPTAAYQPIRSPLRSIEGNVAASSTHTRNEQSSRAGVHGVLVQIENGSSQHGSDFATMWEHPRDAPPVPDKSQLQSPTFLRAARTPPFQGYRYHLEGSQSTMPRKKSLDTDSPKGLSLRAGKASMTPTRIPQRRHRMNCISASSSSPRLTAAIESQFGLHVGVTADGSPRARTERHSRVMRTPLRRAMGNSPSSLESSIFKERDPQVVGSQRMVDLFLSSRRRRMASSDETGAFV